MANRDLFGTDGVRAIAGQYPLDDQTVTQIGMAIAKQFADFGDEILIGQDTRSSSPSISSSLVDGLVRMGVKVRNVGVIPTPGISYLTKKTGASAGVMVTASHNPVEYNGIKVFGKGGRKLTDGQEENLNSEINSEIHPTTPGALEDSSTLAKEYIDFLSSSTNTKLNGLKIVIDTANGAASAFAKQVFENLGAQVETIFDRPDGNNINDGCGATNTDQLKQKVIDNGFDAGVAFDGDADRVVLIDSKGRELNGDHIVYIVASVRKMPAVATTIMSNQGLEVALASKGIVMHRTKVGDRYILDKLDEQNLTFGGEQSGHIIFYDLSPTGDGMLAAVQVLAAVSESAKTLDRWYDELKLMSQKIENINVSDKSKISENALEEFSANETKALAGLGRVLVRVSGTEPVVRLMVEGYDADGLLKHVRPKLDIVLKEAGL